MKMKDFLILLLSTRLLLKKKKEKHDHRKEKRNSTFKMTHVQKKIISLQSEKTAHKNMKEYKEKLELEEDSFPLPLNLIELNPPTDKPDFSGSHKRSCSFCSSLCCCFKNENKQPNRQGHDVSNVKTPPCCSKKSAKKEENFHQDHKYNISDILKETKTRYSNHTIIPKSSNKIRILKVINLEERFCAIITVNDDHSISLWNDSGDKIANFMEHQDEIKSLDIIQKLEVVKNSNKSLLVFFTASEDHTIKKWEIFLKTSNDFDKSDNGLIFDHENVVIFGQHYQEVNFIKLILNKDEYELISDRTIKIWNVKTHKEKKSIYAHESPVYMLAINEKADKIYSIGYDRKVKLWDKNLEFVNMVKTTEIYVSMVLNQGGDKLYICNKKGVIFYWDTENPSHEFLEKFFDSHHELSFLLTCKIYNNHNIQNEIEEKEDEYLLTGSEKGEIRLWDIKQKKERGRINAHESKITSIYLHSQNFNGNSCASPTSGKGLVYQDDWVYSASDDKTVKRWNLHSIFSINKDHSKSITSISFDSDEKKLISSGIDGKILISELNASSQNENITTLDHGFPVIAAAEVLKNKYLLSIENEGIRIWDINTRDDFKISFEPREKAQNHQIPQNDKEKNKNDKDHKDHRPKRPSGMTCIFILEVNNQDEKDNIEIFIGFKNGDVGNFSFKKKNKNKMENFEETVKKNESPQKQKEQIPKNKESSAQNHKENDKEFDFEFLELYQTSQESVNVKFILVTPSKKKMFFIGGEDHYIKVFDLNEKKTLSSLQGHTDIVEAIVFGLNKNYLISASKDKTINIWNISNNSKEQTLNFHDMPIIAMVISGDKRYVASCDEEKIFVWSPKSYEIILNIQGNSGFLRSLAITSIKDDRIWVFSGSADGRIRSWPIDSGKHFCSEEPFHCFFIRCVRITPDSKYILTGSRDGTVKIWSILEKKYITTVKVSSTMVFRLEVTHDKKKLIAVADNKIKFLT